MANEEGGPETKLYVTWDGKQLGVLTRALEKGRWVMKRSKTNTSFISYMREKEQRRHRELGVLSVSDGLTQVLISKTADYHALVTAVREVLDKGTCPHKGDSRAKAFDPIWNP